MTEYVVKEKLTEQTENDGKYVSCIFCSAGSYRRNEDIKTYERVLGKDKFICPACLKVLVYIFEKFRFI